MAASVEEPYKEFHLCVLGAEAVGKTSFLSRLAGVPFQRKASYKASLEDEANCSCVEVKTSSGLLIFHFYDWGWIQKRKVESINQQLMRGPDGAIFMYDVTERRMKTDFVDYLDWYSRACGFDKPVLIISNKNDQKKRAVQDGEGQALAKAGDKRAYVAISLVDDSGIDDAMLVLSRVMTGVSTLTFSSFGPASESSLAWAKEKAAAREAGIGLQITLPKSKRILLVVLNSSVVEKFVDAVSSSEYSVEAAGSVSVCEEEIAVAFSKPADIADGDDSRDIVSGRVLPIVAIVVPPTASDGQKAALNDVATRFSLAFIVSIPRNVVDALGAALC